MPPQRLLAIDGHVGGLIHHGAYQFVGLVVLEKDEENGCDIADILIKEELSFLFFKQVHQLLQHAVSPFVQKGHDNSLLNRRFL